MPQVAESGVESIIAVTDRGRRIDVERCSVPLRQLRQSRIFAVQDELSTPSKDAAFGFAIDKSGWARNWVLASHALFFLVRCLRGATHPDGDNCLVIEGFHPRRVLGRRLEKGIDDAFRGFSIALRNNVLDPSASE